MDVSRYHEGPKVKRDETRASKEWWWGKQKLDMKISVPK